MQLLKYAPQAGHFCRWEVGKVEYLMSFGLHLYATINHCIGKTILIDAWLKCFDQFKLKIVLIKNAKKKITTVCVCSYRIADHFLESNKIKCIYT